MKTLAIKGFAYRDLDGIRLHMPTLHSQGHRLDSIPTGGMVMTDNLEKVWHKMHHTLFQNHLPHLICSLGLDDKGGWAIVREEVRNVLRPDENKDAVDLYNYILAEKMVFLCFLRKIMTVGYQGVSKLYSISRPLNSTDLVL